MRSRWSRLAAASGIGFVVAVAVVSVIGELKEFQNAGDFALLGSNEVWGTATLLTGFASAALFWFAATLAARMRQLEGGSGRLAAAVNGSGAIIAGMLALEVGVQFALRQTKSADLAALASSIVDGPMLFFPAAVFVGATGLVVLRATGVPSYSTNVARLSVPLSAAFLAGAGLQIFQNYAWINDTGYISFAVWVLVVSIIGVIRWGDLDSRVTPPPARPVERIEPEITKQPGPPRVVKAKASVRRKPVAPKTTVRKPTTRKPPPRKP